jgi:hypothetical protein
MPGDWRSLSSGLPDRGRSRRAWGVLRLIREIGYLQLDPTNVVARNPLLVLWSRVGDYDPAVLDDLLAKRASFSRRPPPPWSGTRPRSSSPSPKRPS